MGNLQKWGKMNIYEMLSDLVEHSTIPEPNKVAAREVIKGLKNVNALGSITKNIESEVKAIPHTHIKETQWDKLNAGMVIDVCMSCGKKLSPPYLLPNAGGNSMYFRR